MDSLERELEVARAAARRSGRRDHALLRRADIAVQSKSDLSPVTAADEAANVCLTERIRGAFPEDGFLSEETPDDEGRLAKRRVWIIDPLDGTRDFLAQTGDFCVLVGLTIDGAPVLGVAYQPVKDAMYFARKGQGAFVEVDGATRPLGASRAQLPSEVRVGISRLNPDEGLGKCLAAAGLAARAVQMGASAKHMALARGEIDAVLNLSAAEMEWDTCAPEVILTESGCTVTDGDGNPFRYNQRDLFRRRGSVASNGKCHGLMLRVMAPCLPEPMSDRTLRSRSPRDELRRAKPATPTRSDLNTRKRSQGSGPARARRPRGDQQQALCARAGGGGVHGHVGHDQIGILGQRPAERGSRPSARRRRRAPVESVASRAPRSP